MLFLAWRYGGEDPYRTYNGLDGDYRPLGHSEMEPRPPRYPSRLRHFVYGAGLYAADIESKLAHGGQAARVANAMGRR
jgi:hypothetical protein